MKKLLTMLAMCIILCCALVLSVSAATSVTDNGSNVTLGDCTIAGLDGVTIPSPTRGLVYSLDDETMTATVTGRGSFAGGTGVSLVFPSSVTYGEKTYILTTINSALFQGRTYDLYIPDSIITIKGGGGSGTFGNSTIDKAYIGAGVKTFGEETFSGSKGYSVFVCKAKPEYIEKHAFNSMTVAYTDIVELDFSEVKRVETVAFNSCKLRMIANFSDKLEFIGENAFLHSSVKKAYIPAGATLSTSAFNNAQALEFIFFEVAKGDTKVLPKEILSNAGAGATLTIVINGKVTFGGQAPFPGVSNKGHKLYLPDIETLEAMLENYVETVPAYKERIENLAVYVCETGKTYKAYQGGTYAETGTAAENHIYSEVAHYDADCSNLERDEKYCYACGDKVVSNEGTELGNHIFETYTKAPTCQSVGYTEFDCTVCGLQEVGAFVDKTAHSNTVEKYGAVNGSTLEVSYYCEYCNTLDRTENVSLVNKCYIEGYGLFDATLEYVSVDANGVATPSGATFDRANIYFPSFVMVGDDVVEVKTVQGFKAKSIRAIYIPDTVTRIAGGSGKGCFGDISTLLIVVVGKGVTVAEQEIFSMGNGATLNEFVWKGTITEIHTFAFQRMKASSTSIPYEFNTNLIYVGKQVNYGGNLIREAHIAKGCNLSEKFAFNDANGLVTVYIEGGDTPETALDLGQEFTSNTGTKYYYIKGYVTVNGQAVLSGLNNTRIFMESVDAIDVFANAIKKQEFANRMDKATFLDCETQKTWFIRSDADRAEHTVAFFHGGVVTETEASCTQGATVTERCFVCGATVSQEVGEPLEHKVDGGVITVVPNCRDLGKIVYTCIICGDSEEREIFHDYSTHEYKAYIVYAQGFDKNGEKGDKCLVCDGVANKAVTAPIIVALGYSVRDELGARNGLDGGYQINDELLSLYESINGKIKLGIIIANANDASENGLVDALFKIISAKGLQVELTERGYSAFNLSITGINSETLKSLDLLITAYVIADLDGDGALEISYVQYTMPEKDNGVMSFDGVSLNTVSVNRACPVALAPASYTGKEN